MQQAEAALSKWLQYTKYTTKSTRKCILSFALCILSIYVFNVFLQPPPPPAPTNQSFNHIF